MTLSYLALNLAVTIVLVALVWRSVRTLSPRATALNLAGLLLAAIVFDNLIVGLGIVAYDPERILGLKVGFAPVEDFLYTLVAALGVPAVYRWLGERKSNGK